MADPLQHTQSSARKFGGKPEDYLAIHNWFDESKSFFTDFRHSALRHHAEGIFLAERIFGITVVNRDRDRVPVRYVGEQHVKEDLDGYLPPKTGCHKSAPSGGCMVNASRASPLKFSCRRLVQARVAFLPTSSLWFITRSLLVPPS
jgi:hypothetical protein